MRETIIHLSDERFVSKALEAADETLKSKLSLGLYDYGLGNIFAPLTNAV